MNRCDKPSDSPPAEHPPAAPPATDHEVPLRTSTELMGAHSEIRIAHGDTVYRLRRTAMGKLILTK
ncbi:MAG: hemin uptake protein HemP [Gammaproteobacteria bacterium]